MVIMKRLKCFPVAFITIFAIISYTHIMLTSGMARQLSELEFLELIEFIDFFYFLPGHSMLISFFG